MFPLILQCMALFQVYECVLCCLVIWQFEMTISHRNGLVVPYGRLCGNIAEIFSRVNFKSVN